MNVPTFRSRKAFLDRQVPAVWAVDDLLRQSCQPVGIVPVNVALFGQALDLPDEDVLAALRALADGDLIVWDEDGEHPGKLYVCGFAADTATPLGSLSWSLAAVDSGVPAIRDAILAELEVVQAAAGRPALTLLHGGAA